MATTFTVSRPIIYSKLLTPCVLLVESRPGSLCQRLIAADSFNWSNCGALILCTGKKIAIEHIRLAESVSVCVVTFSPRWLLSFPNAVEAYRSSLARGYTGGKVNSIKP